jgi:transposase
MESVVILWTVPDSKEALMWKPEHRRAAVRKGLRYPNDLNDEEWALIAPLIPPAKRGGRRREIDVREVLNAIFYVLSTGCQWQALPKDLPPKSTAHAYFMLWNWDGTLERIHNALYVQAREREGRDASPTVAIIDSQSAKAAQKGAKPSIRRASMLARKSRAASATSSSIRLVCC